MNVNKLAYVKEAKYLGVIICNDLKDDGDILRHLRNFYARSLDQKISPLFRGC